MSIEGRLVGNRYEILEKIGNGGMATVYKAMDKILKRYVAVKILRDEYTTDEEFIKRFECEAQSAAKLSHQNIVSVYDVGVDGNLYYIVMELIQGKTLKELIIEERGPLPWKWAVNVAIQIAAALEVAHRNNIVHRDIKPHNIIITEEGVSKVTDFGIAKAVSNSTITSFGTTIGSVHYFSPEHARGGYTDAKSDLYSLGVVMYEMMTGKVPFDADTPVSVALKHMQEEPEEPIEINSNIPVTMNKIIVKALQKDVNLRYQTATDIVKDLKMVLKKPTEDFVNVEKYDPTAKTQVLGRVEAKSTKSTTNKTNRKDEEMSLFKKHKVVITAISVIILLSILLASTMAIINNAKPDDVEIPQVVGMTEAEAIVKVEESGLEIVNIGEEYNKDVEAGKIISQKPEFREGYTIKEGTEIEIIISKGAEKAIVPKVIGETKDEAIKLLEDAKFKVEVLEVTSDTIEEGAVVTQSSEANSEMFAGDTIVIEVSIGTGIEKVTVPSVITKTEADAIVALEAAKLTVEVVYDEDSTKSDGVVIKQSIDVGTVLDAGTKVIITVNKLPELKPGVITVNLKSVLNYEPEEPKEDEDPAPVEKADVRIEVNGDIVYSQSVSKDETSIVQTYNGKGNVEIKLYVDNILKGTKQINMNNETNVLFE